MPGLGDDDAIGSITGARDALVPLFRSVEGHPLLVQALVREIARDRRSSGDFGKWKERRAEFDPAALPAKPGSA